MFHISSERSMRLDIEKQLQYFKARSEHFESIATEKQPTTNIASGNIFGIKSDNAFQSRKFIFKPRVNQNPFKINQNSLPRSSTARLNIFNSTTSKSAELGYENAPRNAKLYFPEFEDFFA